MNSDTKFPSQIPPFRFPVPPPDTEPDDPPLVQVCINFPWMAYVLGALKSLMLQATWDTDDPDVRELALQRTELLIGMFTQASDGCGISVPSILCISGSFTDLSYGFVPALAADCSPVWTVGVGWESCFSPAVPADVMELERFFTEATFIRHFALAINNSNALIPYQATITFFLNGTSVFSYSALVVTTDITIEQDVNVEADTWLIDLRAGNLAHEQTFTLENFELCYTGAFPLASHDVWEHTFDFETNPFSSVWSIPGSLGVYTAGVGYEVTNVSHYRGLQLSCALPFARSLTSYSYNYSKTDCYFNPGSYTFADQVVKNFGAGDQVQLATYGCDTGSGLARNLSFTQNNVTEMFFDLFTFVGDGSQTPPSSGSDGVISRITLRGIGSDPF